MALPSSLPTPLEPTFLGGPTLRWGIAAPGFIAGRFASAILRHTDQPIVAVASRSRDRSAAFAAEHNIPRAYSSYDELFDDSGVDAVYVAPPHTGHKDLALRAIAAGKHVLVEKPIAVTAADARAIADAAREAGVFAMEAMHTRFHPKIMVIDQLLRDGVLGDITTVSGDLGFQAPVDHASRLYDPDLAGGAALDIGVYPLWFVSFVMGQPNSVSALGKLTDTEVDAYFAAVLTRPQAPQGVVTASMVNWSPSHGAINGTAGRIHLDSRLPMPGSFVLYGPDNVPHLTFTDESGIVGHEGLCRQAVWMAQNVSDGLLESPMHPLSMSIGVLQTIDSVRAQLGNRDPSS